MKRVPLLLPHGGEHTRHYLIPARIAKVSLRRQAASRIYSICWEAGESGDLLIQKNSELQIERFFKGKGSCYEIIRQIHKADMIIRESIGNLTDPFIWCRKRYCGA